MVNHEVFEKFQCILTGVDASENAQKAFKYAVTRAYQEGAKLIICTILEIDEMNVYEVMDENYMAQQRKKLLHQLKEYQQYAEAHGVKEIELMSEEGDPAEKSLR